MRLLRVQVPEFRALKDVDISFEPEFVPQVFPLGSLNGGGKSTLLQLIFVLLHCFGNIVEEQRHYLENITSDVKKSDKEVNTLAVITLLTDRGKVSLEYIYGDEKSIIDYRNKRRNNGRGICYYEGSIFHNLFYLELVTFIDNPLPEILEGGYDSELSTIRKKIKEKVFLIAPSNQSYIFLNQENRRLLFNKNIFYNSQFDKNYKHVIDSFKDTLPKLHTYDFNDVLTEVFNQEYAKDARERTITGKYGANVEKLENAINSFFIDGKKIVPFIPEQERHVNITVQGVTFKLTNGTEIYPEDLSHGELKRLAIFVLIKYHDIQDSIVLMDEIENGFHPDWQRHIVDDLVEWGASNQYILATHSYELCRGVTPAHVKELESNWHVVS